MEKSKKGISTAWFWDPVICEAKRGAGNRHGVSLNAAQKLPISLLVSLAVWTPIIRHRQCLSY